MAATAEHLAGLLPLHLVYSQAHETAIEVCIHYKWLTSFLCVLDDVGMTFVIAFAYLTNLLSNNPPPPLSILLPEYKNENTPNKDGNKKWHSHS